VVLLGLAGEFAILAKEGISTIPASAINGNVGVSPIAPPGMTGFSLVADSSNTYSTSTQITGQAYAPDYTSPTPAMMTSAILDMQMAYSDAKSRPDCFLSVDGEVGVRGDASVIQSTKAPTCTGVPRS